jgi:hypothetical protein
MDEKIEAGQELHQGLVQSDADKPGREFGVFPELIQMQKCFQEGFLHDVLGVFPVVHEVVRDSKQFAVVSVYKFLKGADISTLAGMDQG